VGVQVSPLVLFLLQSEPIIKRLLICLLLVGVVGCGPDAQKAQDENTGDPNANTEATTTNGALSDEQVTKILSQRLGRWEGTTVIKGPDGKVQSEYPKTETTTWLEKGKSTETQVTEKLPQGDQQLVFTKWYDKEQQHALLPQKPKR
jgi:hypothetical protein